MKSREIRETLKNTNKRGAWAKGVIIYAVELMDEFIENYGEEEIPTREQLKNGAINWREYSWGGASLIYDTDIAERLCNPTELKRTDYGRKNPNNNEYWLDVQARALFQACDLIEELARKEG